MVSIYSSITGAPRTVSMGFDLGEIIQSQGLRHSLSPLFRIIEISRGGFFRVSSPSVSFIVPSQLRSLPPCRESQDRKAFANLQQKKSFRWMSGCPLQGGSKDQTPLPICFPVGFSSRIVFHIETATDIMKGLTPLPPCMPA